MPYTKEHLVARSGLPERTIRNYIKRGLVPPPEGYGSGATYGDEHMCRVVAIGRMRADGDPIAVITERIAGWTTAKFKRYVTQTDPPPPPSPVAAAPAAPTAPVAGSPPLPPLESPDAEGEPVAPGEAPLRRPAPIGELTLPDGPSFRVIALLPGPGLMLDTRASPVVQRIAAEICDRYGQR
jgi:hypothetical protein